MPNGRFYRYTDQRNTFHLKTNQVEDIGDCSYVSLMFILPSIGILSNGSFFNTSMPSPPPVSFLDTSATE